MSPVSRARKVKRNKRSARRSAVPYAVGVPAECDCPSCTATGSDPQAIIDGLISTAADLVESEDPLDPLDPEMMAATLMAIGYGAGDDFGEALIQGFIPEVEARASSEAMIMLLAIGSVAGGRVGDAAAAAGARLVEADVPRPLWAAELGEPVTVADCWRLVDSGGFASMLACSFRRAGRAHTVVMSVDHLDCGAAGGIRLLDGDQMGETLQMLQAIGREEGLEVTTEELDAGEFRWQVEKALDARAVHDSDPTDGEPDELPSEEDGPGYPALAILLRARMRALPTPRKAAPPHGDDEQDLIRLTARQIMAQLAADIGDPFGARTKAATRGRTAVAALPAKRRKSARPAPVYQIKVSLRGAKPPIWRRLEVPADISLARLHTTIQIAFGWDDSHLHAFETPYGDFGTGDDRSRRAESSVTLEQVAPEAKSRLRYTYDFGDQWEHDILVEKVLGPGETLGCPRCIGGRRAAPPEDCGGIWGYDELVQVLNNPGDQEYEDRLDWLGLASAEEFDPDKFDAQEVTRALTLVR